MSNSISPLDMNKVMDSINENKSKRHDIKSAKVKFEEIEIDMGFDWGEFDYNVDLLNRSYDTSQDAPFHSGIMKKFYAAITYPQVRINSYIVRAFNEVMKYKKDSSISEMQDDIDRLKEAMSKLEDYAIKLEVQNSELRNEINELKRDRG